MLRNFDELREKVKQKNRVFTAVVAGADDEHALESVFALEEDGIIRPILVGAEEKINTKLEEMGLTGRSYEILCCEEEENPAELAVRLVRAGEGDFILKGKIHTKALLKPILNKDGGLNGGSFITHFALMQLKKYHKLMVMSDSAVIPFPKLEEKIKIVKLCVETMSKIGIAEPVIAALCAVEVPTDRMPDTLEALELSKLSDEGKLGGCKVIGPISYDLAIDRESAKIKGYDSPYTGNIDMILVPNMVTGNVMSKILSREDGNILAGCFIGADVPIAVTSRSGSTAEKLNSLLLCCALS